MVFHVENGIHPFTLLLLQTALAFAVRSAFDTIQRRHSTETETDLKWHSARKPKGTSRALLQAAVISSALTWILTIAALRISNNPLVVFMIVSLRFRRFGTNHDESHYHQKRDLLALFLQAVGILFVLRYDYRLTPGSLAVLLGLLTTCNITHLLRDHIHSTTHDLSKYSFQQPRLLPFCALLSISGILSCLENWQHGIMIWRSPWSLLMTINVLSGAISMAIGGGTGIPLQYSAHQQLSSIFAQLTPPMLFGIIAAAYHILARDTMLPLQQMAAYALALLLSSQRLLSTSSHIHDLASSSNYALDHLEEDSTSDDSRSESSFSLEDTIETRPIKVSFMTKTGLTVIISLAVTCWAVLISQSASIIPPFLSATPTAHLAPPVTNGSARSLDLVVSYYDESVQEMAHNIGNILKVPSTSEAHPRVFVYNKGSKIENAALHTELVNSLSIDNDTIKVSSLPNYGREAETYLNHILDKWEDLASHTIFTQASMHEPEWAIQHLDSYLSSETGFLSLSYSSNFCRSCSECTDLAGWRPAADTMQEIYQMAYEQGATCRNVPLTYKGQFVASSRRIKGGGKDMYQKLQARLIDDNGSPGINIEYGFLLERMWGVIMQCADERIADRCPSLFSNTLGRLGDMRDCQCLDSPDQGTTTSTARH